MLGSRSPSSTPIALELARRRCAEWALTTASRTIRPLRVLAGGRGRPEGLTRADDLRIRGESGPCARGRAVEPNEPRRGPVIARCRRGRDGLPGRALVMGRPRASLGIELAVIQPVVASARAAARRPQRARGDVAATSRGSRVAADSSTPAITPPRKLKVGGRGPAARPRRAVSGRAAGRERLLVRLTSSDYAKGRIDRRDMVASEAVRAGPRERPGPAKSETGEVDVIRALETRAVASAPRFRLSAPCSAASPRAPRRRSAPDLLLVHGDQCRPRAADGSDRPASLLLSAPVVEKGMKPDRLLRRAVRIRAEAETSKETISSAAAPRRRWRSAHPHGLRDTLGDVDFGAERGSADGRPPQPATAERAGGGLRATRQE